MAQSDHPPPGPVRWLAWPVDCWTAAERLARCVRLGTERGLQHRLPAQDAAAAALGLLREQVQVERLDAPGEDYAPHRWQ